MALFYKRSSIIFFLGSSLSFGCVCAQQTVMDLWPEGKIPNQHISEEREEQERNDILLVRNVQQPQLEVFLPAKRYATGEAVLIFPGGGYYVLAYDWEGRDIAKWLNSQGIAGIVVKYRLPVSKSLTEGYKVPIQDAQRAIRLVRSQAKAWNIDDGKIGILGFSAGGHLASSLGTHYSDQFYSPLDTIDSLSARPDFMGLVYAVTDLSRKDGQVNLGNPLLGDFDSPELRNRFSNQLHVTQDTPRTFLLHAADDLTVPLSHTILFLTALYEHHVPVECHIYPKGDHGFALAVKQPYVETWKKLFIDWVKDSD